MAYTCLKFRKNCRKCKNLINGKYDIKWAEIYYNGKNDALKKYCLVKIINNLFPKKIYNTILIKVKMRENYKNKISHNNGL